MRNSNTNYMISINENLIVQFYNRINIVLENNSM